MNAIAFTHGALDYFVQRARQLYSLPAVAIQVMRLTESERVDVPALRKCIEIDPALTSKILRVVNSSMFGLSGKVSSLDQALALLGTKPLKLLVLGFSLPNELYTGIDSNALALYWRRALTKAVTARELSVRCWKISGDEAFLAGLLQDLGLLLLLQELGGAYSRMVASTLSRGGDLGAVERSTLGFEHKHLSARLLEHWNFPKSIVQSVSSLETIRDGQGSESEEEEDKVAKIVQLANLLTELLADKQETHLGEILKVSQDIFGLRPEDIQTVVSSVESQVAQLAEVLSLQLSPSEGYEGIMLRASEQLSAVAEEAATEMAVGVTFEILDSQDAMLVAETIDSIAKQPQGKKGTIRSEGSESTFARESEDSTESKRATGQLVGPAAVASGDANAECEELIKEAIIRSRRSHRPVSFILAEINDLADGEKPSRNSAVQWRQKWLTRGMTELTDAGEKPVHIDECRFAILLEGCDRMETLQKGRELVARFHESEHPDGITAVLRVGVASVARASLNFSPYGLFEAAERCLFAAQTASGSCIKSIDLF